MLPLAKKYKSRRSSSAPITLVEFEDFQCDKCARFVRETKPKLNEVYIQTGKIDLVFIHFPICGIDSKIAAMAAQCINEQGKFWEFYDILYKNQGPKNCGWASKDNLKKFALQIPELNIQKFNYCLDNEEYKSHVEEDLAFATSLGLYATPSFIIMKSDGSDPEILIGAYTFSSFKVIIDKNCR
jgi:protein-disulfide isomerase